MGTIPQQQITALEALCQQIGKLDYEVFSKLALAMNEDENLHPEIRSLALDAMLVAEGDFNGEFHSKAELLSALQSLRKAAE